MKDIWSRTALAKQSQASLSQIQAPATQRNKSKPSKDHPKAGNPQSTKGVQVLITTSDFFNHWVWECLLHKNGLNDTTAPLISTHLVNSFCLLFLYISSFMVSLLMAAIFQVQGSYFLLLICNSSLCINSISHLLYMLYYFLNLLFMC